MKTSNKILIGMLAFTVISFILFLIITRVNIDPDAVSTDVYGERAETTHENLDFNEVEVNTAVDLYLMVGQPSLRLEGPKDVIDKLSVEVNGERLLITPKPNVHHMRGTIQAYVTVDSLTLLKFGGHADVRTNDDLSVDHLRIEQSGSGRSYMNLTGQQIDININGSATFNLNGHAEEINTSINGSGNINALEFKVKNAQINTSGSGNVHIHVTDELYVQISGSGDVQYQGQPRTNVNVSGSGKVYSEWD